MRSSFAFFAPALLLVACTPAEDIGYVTPDNVVDVADGWEEADVSFAPAGPLLLAESSPGSEVAGGEITFADDGEAFAAWVAFDNYNGDVWLARSRDGGETWEDAVPVEVGSSPAVTGVERRPYVAVTEDRVAVVWTSNPDPATWVAIADRTDQALSFGEPFDVGTSTPDDLEDFANLVFLEDGELVVVTHVSDPSDWSEALWITRESEGWAAEPLTDDAPGEPCACCAIDLLATADGGLLVAYRNNIDNIRDQFVLTVHPSGDVTWAQASFTNWELAGCPMQGPRIERLPDGELVILWSDPTAGESQIWIAHSHDDGANWHGEKRLTDASATGAQRWPRVGMDDGGDLHVAFQVANEVWSVKSHDGGIIFGDAERLETPDGPLLEAELAIGPRGAAMVGRSGELPEDAAVWFIPVE